MQNVVLSIVFVISTYAFGGYSEVFPVFEYDGYENNRVPWMEYENNGTPITVESGSSFGLTNPASNQNIHFLFLTTDDSISFDLTSYQAYGVEVDYLEIQWYDNTLKEVYIDGDNNSYGLPVTGITIYGEGIVDIYEQVPGMRDYGKIGSFNVENSIPEPATFFLIAPALIFTLINKKDKSCE